MFPCLYKDPQWNQGRSDFEQNISTSEEAKFHLIRLTLFASSHCLVVSLRVISACKSTYLKSFITYKCFLVIKKWVVVFKLLGCCAGERQILIPSSSQSCCRLFADSGTLLSLGMPGSFRPVAPTVKQQRPVVFLVAFLQGRVCRKWINALYFTGGKELWIQTKLPLQVRNSNRGICS